MEDVEELFDLLGAKLSLNYLEIRESCPGVKSESILLFIGYLVNNS